MQLLRHTSEQNLHIYCKYESPSRIWNPTTSTERSYFPGIRGDSSIAWSAFAFADAQQTCQPPDTS